MGRSSVRYFAVSVLGLASMLAACPGVKAALVIRLPDVTVFTNTVDPVVGSFFVLLETDAPDPIGGYNLDFTRDNLDLTFGTPELVADVDGPLFPASTFPSLDDDDSTTSNIKVFIDIIPNEVNAFNNAKLVKIPFTIAPNNGGVVNLTWNAALTEITNGAGVAYAPTLDPGVITIAVIPEAAAWKALGLVALVCIGSMLLRRRKLALATAN